MIPYWRVRYVCPLGRASRPGDRSPDGRGRYHPLTISERHPDRACALSNNPIGGCATSPERDRRSGNRVGSGLSPGVPRIHGTGAARPVSPAGPPRVRAGIVGPGRAGAGGEADDDRHLGRGAGSAGPAEGTDVPDPAVDMGRVRPATPRPSPPVAAWAGGDDQARLRRPRSSVADALATARTGTPPDAPPRTGEGRAAGSSPPHGPGSDGRNPVTRSCCGS